MDKLPKNITRYDLAKIKYNAQKLCGCKRPNFIVDPKNRIIECGTCNAHLDPIDALVRLTRFYDQQDDYFERRLEEQRAVTNYKPHLLVIRKIAEMYGATQATRMWPSCPHCNETFDLAELRRVVWSNPKYLSRNHEGGDTE